jgi:pantothenate kinase-related protein Tda10
MQGCGKTTLTNIVCDLFRMDGKSCITMSLDDFYLTGQQQEQLFGMYKHNPLLEFRGNGENPLY